MVLRVAHEQFVTKAAVRAADSCGCVTPSDPPDAELDLIIDAASDAIARVTGMRVAGRRQWLARPCRSEYGQDCCSCCGLDAIPLGDNDPVVDQVKIDGAVVDPATYQLHPTRIGMGLVKVSTDLTRPTNWPSSQPLWAPDSEDGTFSILYTTGSYVEDLVISDAAIEIVCDLAAGTASTVNALDPRVTQATVGGVTMVLEEDRIERVRSGDFGPMTARMMGLLAPTGTATSAVWAPELAAGWDLHLRTP
jgi:hypothetical protein